MSSRILVPIVATLSICTAACGASAPLAPSGSSSAVAQLRGSTLNAIDGQPLGGVTIRAGSQSAVSDASGAYQLEHLTSGTQEVIFSAPSVVERRTSLVAPSDGVVQQTLIPATYDLAAFDQMFRATGRLERWINPPALVVLTTVMNFDNGFGNSSVYKGTSEQLSEAETDLLVSHLLGALATLTGNTFLDFDTIERESVASGANVSTIRPGKIVVGRYKGVQALASTIGFGGHITDDSGRITAGAIYLDKDFDKASDLRRLLRTHELGHTLGYNHVTTRTSIMNPAIGPDVTTFDRQGAIIAFQRLPGNESPDSDPSAPAKKTNGGIFTVRP